MKLQSRLHQLTELREDAWIFRGDRPERIVRIARTALDAFNTIGIIAAVALFLTYWIGVLVTP